jgi:hypothetical protein
VAAARSWRHSPETLSAASTSGDDDSSAVPNPTSSNRGHQRRARNTSSSTSRPDLPRPSDSQPPQPVDHRHTYLNGHRHFESINSRSQSSALIHRQLA